MQRYTWFYSLESPLSPEAKGSLQRDIDQFLGQWKSHGTPVDGLVSIAHDRFVIVRSNPAEDRPSGCSIDGLKRAMEQILQHNRLQVLDAAHVYFRKGDEIAYTHFKQVADMLKEGELSADHIIFDHSLGQSDELDRWEIPLKDSWLKRYLANA